MRERRARLGRNLRTVRCMHIRGIGMWVIEREFRASSSGFRCRVVNTSGRVARGFRRDSDVCRSMGFIYVVSARVSIENLEFYAFLEV